MFDYSRRRGRSSSRDRLVRRGLRQRGAALSERPASEPVRSGLIAFVYAVLWLHLALPVLLFGGFPGAPPFLHTTCISGIPGRDSVHGWTSGRWPVSRRSCWWTASSWPVSCVRRRASADGWCRWWRSSSFSGRSSSSSQASSPSGWSTRPSGPSIRSPRCTACRHFAAAGLAAVRRRRGDVAALVVELDKVRVGDVRERLAQVLGDPSVVVGLWSPEREAWLDRSGQAVAVPADGSRGVSYLGDRRGVVIHDRDLLDQPRLVEAAGSAALLALENDRLQARLRAQMAEVRDSRTRLVEGDDRERRSLQRDLRTGSSCSSASSTPSLAALSGRLDVAGESLLTDVRGELAVALTELDELAHGIHPAVLARPGWPRPADARGPDAGPGRRPLVPGRLPRRSKRRCTSSSPRRLQTSHATRAPPGIGRGAADRGLARIQIHDDGIGGANPDQRLGAPRPVGESERARREAPRPLAPRRGDNPPRGDPMPFLILATGPRPDAPPRGRAGRREKRTVADFVVQLGETEPGEVRGLIAGTLGDPTLELGSGTRNAGPGWTNTDTSSNCRFTRSHLSRR